MNAWDRLHLIARSSALALLASAAAAESAHAQFMVKPFQASNLRPIQAAAFENEADVAGHGDTLVAVWTDGGGCANQVGWATSTDSGTTWIYGGHLPTPWWGFAQPSICLGSGGSFHTASLLYSPYEAIMVHHGAFAPSGFSWGPPAPAVETLDDSRFLTPELACDPSGADLYLCYTQTRESPPIVLYSEVRFVRSTDSGGTWSAPMVLSGSRSSGGRMGLGPEGEVYVMWLDHAQGTLVGRASTDHGASFGPVFTVAPVHDNPGAMPPGWSACDVLHPLYFDGVDVDLPSLAIDRSTGPRRGAVYVAWTERGLGELQPITGYTGEQEPNDSYATANRLGIGQVVTGSVPSADFGGNDQGDFYYFDGVAGMTIEVSGTLQSTDTPDALSYRVYCGSDPASLRLVDRRNAVARDLGVAPFIFTLPVTGRYWIETGGSTAPSRTYSLALRELVVTQGQAARDHRDVVLVSSPDGGATWSPRARANDDPPGYDNALPAVAVDAGGRVHVSWYDRRHTSDCGEASAHTYWTWSEDGGQTFAPSTALSTSAADYWQLGEDWRVGRYQTLQPVGERVYALWGQVVGYDDADVYGARLEPETQTPVLVSGLKAEWRGAVVVLRWYVGVPEGIAGFRVHRGASEEDWVVAAELGGGAGAGWREWEDREVTPNRVYRYRVEVRSAGGGSLWEGPVEVVVPGQASRMSWGRVTPNPFGDVVELELVAPRGGPGVVTVYDVRGHRVASLYRGSVQAGNSRFRWDGRDSRGRAVPAGVYLVRGSVGSEEAMARVLRIR